MVDREAGSKASLSVRVWETRDGRIAEVLILLSVLLGSKCIPIFFLLKSYIKAAYNNI